MIKIYTDGGSRGNPGPSAIGVAIYDTENNLIHSISRYIGRTTNNIAEYTALIEALGWVVSNAKKIKEMPIHIYTDSLLLRSQVVGLYKVKNPALKELYKQIKFLESKYSLPINYFHIRREKNNIADTLVNKALDYEIKNF